MRLFNAAVHDPVIAFQKYALPPHEELILSLVYPDHVALICGCADFALTSSAFTVCSGPALCTLPNKFILYYFKNTKSK